MSTADHRLSVLVVTPRFRPDRGGIETVVERTAEQFAARGVDVTVLTAARGLPSDETVQTPGGSYRVRRSRLLPGQTFELPLQLLWTSRRQARKHDIVHVHSYHALYALLGAMTAGRRPLVFTPHYHGTGHTGFRSLLHRLYRPLGRYVLRRASLVYANSEAEAALLRRDHGAIVAGKVEVLWNGVAAPEHVQGIPAREGLRRVISVCRLEPYKRVDLLVEATLLQAGRDPGNAWELVVVGEGSDRGRLESLAAGSDLVRFTGRLSDEDLAHWWHGSDLFATASEQESFGLGVAQALAGGLRCSASAIPAHREIVETVGSGNLVTDATPQAWADAISRSLDEPAVIASIPGWDHVAHTLEASYRRLLEAHES